MVVGIKKDTVSDILLIFSTIIFFQAIPRLDAVGKFLDNNPWVLVGVALIILIFRRKIAESIGE